MKRTSLIVCSLLIIVASGKLRLAEGMLPTEHCQASAGRRCEMQYADIFRPLVPAQCAIMGLGSADNPFRFFCTASFGFPAGAHPHQLPLRYAHDPATFDGGCQYLPARILGYQPKPPSSATKGLPQACLSACKNARILLRNMPALRPNAVRSRILDSLAAVFETCAVAKGRTHPA